MFLVRQVHGASMSPQLEPGTVVIATRVFRTLKPDDVVILQHKGREKIKRISRISIDKIFVEGDNSAHSTDSRHFGWLEKKVVSGKVIWPRIPHVNQKSPR